MADVRTWIEIDRNALHHNVGQFLKLVGRARFLAVIKSNAYGHGLWHIAKELRALRRFSEEGWFGVDSIVEGLRLRREGIKNPILILGATLPSRIGEAHDKGITLAVSNFDALRVLARMRERPDFHLKLDTGMHRQGFLSDQINQLIKLIKLFKLNPSGVFTHFAAAKDIAYPTYTLRQLAEFNKAVSALRRAGFKNMIRHTAASGGTLLFPETRLDMVRIGMGMYGYWPSQEAKISFLIPAKSKVKSQKSKVYFKPVLTWKTVITEIKEIPAGSHIGYDLTESVSRKTKIAVLPIGYWHGYDRGLSSIGEVLLHGRRAKVLGRVSMDILVVDATSIRGVRVGDEAVLIGRQGKESIWADEIAQKIGTTQYEVLTRINPLIRRIII